MKRLILILFFTGLSSTGIYAQKAYLDGSRIILDFTGNGMLPNTVTTTKKYTGSTQATNTSYIVNESYAAEANKMVYEKLEIAPKDLNASGNLGTAVDYDGWAKAYNACKNLTYDSGNGSWRLPTYREMIFVWVFNPALNSLFSISGGEPLIEETYYITATEPSATTYIRFRMENGTSGSSTKTAKNQTIVRCVREVD